MGTPAAIVGLTLRVAVSGGPCRSRFAAIALLSVAMTTLRNAPEDLTAAR